MPGPDPFGIYIEEREDGRFTVISRVWARNKGGGSSRARLHRMQAIAQRLKSDTWRRDWCNGPIPISKRVDALYCREACRKAAARFRRRNRQRRQMSTKR